MKASNRKIIFYIVLFFIFQVIFIFLKKDLRKYEIFDLHFFYSVKGIIVYSLLVFVDIINFYRKKQSV